MPITVRMTAWSPPCTSPPLPRHQTPDRTLRLLVAGRRRNPRTSDHPPYLQTGCRRRARARRGRQPPAHRARVREGSLYGKADAETPAVPSAVAGTPIALDAILRRMVTVEPAERWPDPVSFATALHDAAQSPGPPAWRTADAPEPTMVIARPLARRWTDPNTVFDGFGTVAV